MPKRFSNGSRPPPDIDIDYGGAYPGSVSTPFRYADSVGYEDDKIGRIGTPRSRPGGPI